MAAAAPSFSLADYLVFSASLLISLGIGLYHWYKSRGRGTKEFFMGGGEMSVLPVTLSFMVGIISAVSLLGNSSELYYYGSQLWFNVFGMMAGTAIVATTVVPVMYPLKLITLYEFLEVRWHSRLVRKLATVVQLINLSTFMGIALYAPSLAISSVTPITTNTSVVVLGVVCCVYASLGGAKAVVYTDAFQSVVLVAGVVVVVVRGCLEVGGGAAAWAIDQHHGRIEFFNLDPSPLERHTVMTTTVFGMYFAISTFGVSQAQFQRWGSVASLSKSYLVLGLGGVGLVSLFSLINYSGLVVFSVYAECDPLTAGYIHKSDQILMYFVADKLGYLPGIPGLFVAAVYSGVLSTVSSTINATSAMVWRDLLQPLATFSSTTDERAKTINIIISAVTGGVTVVLGVLAGSMGGLVQVTYALGGALGGPIAGIFLTAIWCPWVKLWSVLLATAVSLALNMWIVLGNFLYAAQPEMLPLSIAECPDLNDTTTTTTTFPTAPTFPTTDDTYTGDEVFPLYRLSYCLYGAIGVLTTLVMSTLFSCFFGFTAPASVPVVAVNRHCLRFYCWLRGADVPLDMAGQHQPWPQHDSESAKGGSAGLGSEASLGVWKSPAASSDAPGLHNPGFVDECL